MIESTWVPRAFVLLGFVTIVDGCAHRRSPATTAAAAAAKTQLDVPIDVTVKTLPRAHFPTPPLGLGPSTIASEEKVPGIFSADLDGGPRYTGIKDRGRALAAISATPDDPPSDSYCLQTSSSAGSTMVRRSMGGGMETLQFQPTLLEFTAGANGVQERLHAERVDDSGKDGGKNLDVVTAWAENGGVRLVDKGTIPMRLLGAMSGVEVFAFVDEGNRAAAVTPSIAAPTSANPRGTFTPAAEKEAVPTPAVNLVIVRPPIKKQRVRGGAMLATLPDGSAGHSGCRHARVVFPLVRGDGATAAFVVAVETEKGVRGLRVNMSTLWLKSEADARVTARFDWDGQESDLFPSTTTKMHMADMRRRGGDGF